MDAPTTRPTVQADQIFLTGAFILTTGSAQQYVAFFEGSRPEYNVSRKLGDSIVGYQIAEIRTGGVRLAQNNEQIVIPVSCGLTRQGEGKWQVTSEGSLSGRPEPPPSLSTSSRASSGAASSSSSGPPSDILKKLMERRRQQESGK